MRQLDRRRWKDYRVVQSPYKSEREPGKFARKPHSADDIIGQVLGENICKECGGKCCHNKKIHVNEKDPYFSTLRRRFRKGGKVVLDYSTRFEVEMPEQGCHLLDPEHSCKIHNSKPETCTIYPLIEDSLFMRCLRAIYTGKKTDSVPGYFIDLLMEVAQFARTFGREVHPRVKKRVAEWKHPFIGTITARLNLECDIVKRLLEKEITYLYVDEIVSGSRTNTLRPLLPILGPALVTLLRSRDLQMEMINFVDSYGNGPVIPFALPYVIIPPGVGELVKGME